MLIAVSTANCAWAKVMSVDPASQSRTICGSGSPRLSLVQSVWAAFTVAARLVEVIPLLDSRLKNSWSRSGWLWMVGRGAAWGGAELSVAGPEGALGHQVLGDPRFFRAPHCIGGPSRPRKKERR